MEPRTHTARLPQACFLPLLARLDALLQNGPLVMAIDGGSASGKTTLSEQLNERYDCTVFHMDDFFLRPEQRTPERFAQPGGNIDWERVLEQVLIPLRERRPIRYCKFDCSTSTIAPGVEVVPKGLTVIEGVYSMHPELAGFYDLSVFLSISPELQASRIAARNTPETAQQFYSRWIPLEQVYFSHLNVEARCDISISVENDLPFTPPHL